MRCLISLAVFATALAAADADYLFGFVRSAPNPPPMPKEELTKMQAAHLAHIGEMADAGALVAAGPCRDGASLRGIFVFKAASKARELAAQDPFVKAGQLVVDLVSWHATAGIGDKYFAEHKGQRGVPARMIGVQLVLVKKGPALDAAMAKLRGSGKVMASGPVSDSVELGAIAVVQAGSIDAAKELVGGADAAVHAWTVADGVLPEPR